MSISFLLVVQVLFDNVVKHIFCDLSLCFKHIAGQMRTYSFDPFLTENHLEAIPTTQVVNAKENFITKTQPKKQQFM